jgi:hypothetical protein
MSKFSEYIVESASRLKWGAGITFIDIDETVFRTFAMVLVKDRETGKVVRELDNQEFNSYELKDNEEYDFQQFRNADIFRKTSVPIPQTINRIKKMLKSIHEKSLNSKIVFLTARSDFDNKNEFLKTFEEHGIKMDRPQVYVERTGNMKTGTIPERKKQVMMKYIKSGEYRRVRLIDDHKPNLMAIKEIEQELPKEVEEKVIKNYDLDPNTEHLPPISFYALQVLPDGSLKRI